MLEWCMAHPWMTFIVLWALADSIGHIGRKTYYMCDKCKEEKPKTE